uniref:Galactosylgalactosylxylosylprotein 3-beta-glucuronosyltransferase n=1 Tax=Parascaris equorum TaxID=6256 RepID=A0A914SHG8_PAREQ
MCKCHLASLMHLKISANRFDVFRVMFSQTLSHIKNLHWVVIEDGNQTVEIVERILDRSGLPYVYFFTTTEAGFPSVVYFADDDNSYDIRLFDRYIRKVKTIGIWAVEAQQFDNIHPPLPVCKKHFCTPLLKLLTLVTAISQSALRLSGTALVEAPHVVNGTIVGWDVVYAPKRKFATDMAGFARPSQDNSIFFLLDFRPKKPSFKSIIDEQR